MASIDARVTRLEKKLLRFDNELKKQRELNRKLRALVMQLKKQQALLAKLTPRVVKLEKCCVSVREVLSNPPVTGPDWPQAQADIAMLLAAVSSLQEEMKRT